MATRTQKVDFIYNNFTFGGKRMAKKKLKEYSDEALDNFIAKYPQEFEKWLAKPKLITYLWETPAHSGTVKAECESKAREHLESQGHENVLIVRKQGHHFCKYCQGIAIGTYSDLLCISCKEMFGHSLYSEL